MSRRSIVLATRNPGKLREIRQVLSGLPVEVGGLSEHGEIPQPAETGSTFAENARQKARHYARATGRWCLADDSGLEVDALDGAPGVRSARYATENVDPGADRKTIDAANNAKLLAALDPVDEDKRTARFVCHLALADSKGILLETHGTVEGRIARSPRGCNGFGYDPLFLLPDLGRTAAELSPQQKNAVSHRGKAVREFARALAGLLANKS
jgi:XTP/dITP diphosphohydrolase